MKHNEIAGESGGSVPTLSAGKTSIFSLSRVALKERNRVESEGDSPVKRPGRKATRVLGSEGEEEEEEAPTTPRSQVGPQQPAPLPDASFPLALELSAAATQENSGADAPGGRGVQWLCLVSVLLTHLCPGAWVWLLALVMPWQAASGGLGSSGSQVAMEVL